MHTLGRTLVRKRSYKRLRPLRYGESHCDSELLLRPGTYHMSWYEISYSILCIAQATSIRRNCCRPPGMTILSMEASYRRTYRRLGSIIGRAFKATLIAKVRKVLVCSMTEHKAHIWRIPCINIGAVFITSFGIARGTS